MKHISMTLVLAAAITLTACGDETTAPPRSDYLALTSPENLVENLQVAYRKKNIEEYARLLAPEFRFEFQSVDASEIGLEFWNRDQDSTGTDALFRTPLVSDIRIDLTYTAAQDPTEIGFDPGTKKIRIQPTFLEVDQRDGITWQLDGDIQDMFFRKGREPAGEDTTRWFLFEWRDIPSGGGTAVTAFPTTRGTTWGDIKSKYTVGEAPGLIPSMMPGPLAIEPTTWGNIKSKYEIN